MRLNSSASRRSKNRIARATQPAFIESLEGRTLLASSVTAAVSNNVLTVTGRTKNDTITVTEASNNVTVTAGTRTVGTFASSSVKGLKVNAGNGNDLITVTLTTTATTVTITGGLGNDTLIGGNTADSITGNGGNDSILGNTGNDSLFGNEGNDTITCAAGDDQATGGSGNDSILGVDGNDTIDGSGGADTLDGGVGNDSILGGAAVDSLIGGDGNDTLRGGSGGDITDGGAGTDVALTQGHDSQINVETTSPANTYIPVSLADLGVDVNPVADPITTKVYETTITVANVAADSQVSVVWKNRKGNNYNFVIDAKRYSENTSPTNVARDFVFDFGTVDPGTYNIVIYNANDPKDIQTSSFTVTWTAPTG